MTLHRALFCIATSLFLSAAARDAGDRWIARTVLPPLATEVSTEVLDRNGQLLRAYTVADGRWRLSSTLTQVDPLYLSMLVSYEDKRFYSHHGVDLLALGRAAIQSLIKGEVTSGGSTLTMQTARLLEDGPTGEWPGKLRQIRVALALERRLSKDDILTLYLNRAPFGGNVEGLRAATRTWFGKDPWRLTPAQAALLVALPQSPELRRPDRHADAARRARDRVLQRMQRAGLLDADSVATAMRSAVPTTRLAMPQRAPHLADRLIADDPFSTRIITTLDAAVQSKLQDLAALAVDPGGERVSVAILAADHRTGEILASVGSAAYQSDARQGFIDMTQAVRSPGSTLKPLIYGLAFDQGLANPETLIEDRPTQFGIYAPQNFDGQFRGTVHVREALQMSLNIPVVALTQALGPARIIAHLKRAGVTPQLSGETPGLAISLGGIGLSLTDLTQLYASIASGGERVDLHAISGSNKGISAPTVLSRAAAWQVSDILSGLIPPPGAPAGKLAYKTGTSYGHRDAWAIGFDGQHVIGVWLGRPDGTPVPGAFGGELAAPILFQAFARLKPGFAPLPPPPPETLIVANADLPLPLQHFRGRDALFAVPTDAPQLTFPPDGAVLLAGGPLLVRVKSGRPPFAWLVDGQPSLTGSYDRENMLSLVGTGFVRLSVIDATGQSASARIRLE